MPVRKVGVLGSGSVGEALANGFLRHGYEVTRGSRDPRKLDAWRTSAGERAASGSFADAARAADLVVLAVKGTAAEDAVRLAGTSNLAGKIVVDATNPIAEVAPTNGVLHFFTTLEDSLMERLQRLAPKANFVKAFSCVGNAFMVDPDFGGERPTMFIAGNDPAARAEASSLLDRFGWDVEDIGAAEGARAIEPLVALWCAPGFLRNQWTHAFRLLRK